MKSCITFLLTILLSLSALCQSFKPSSTIVSKPPIDSAAIANWYDLGRSDATICSNGKYFMYPIRNLPAGKQTLVVQSIENSWKKEFIGAEPGVFSFDGKYAVFQSADTLFFLALGKDKIEYVTDVSYFTFPINGYDVSYNAKLIAYKLKQNNLLVLRDITNGKQLKIDSASEFKFNQVGNAILIKKIDKNSGLESLNWVDLGTGHTKTIWSNKNNESASLFNYSFDKEGNQVVLLSTDKKNNNNNVIWFYGPHLQEALIKVSNEILHSEGMVISQEAPWFSENGKYIFFKVQARSTAAIKTDTNARGVQVDVWNYKDLVLQPLQAFFKNNHREIPQDYIKTRFTASIDIDDNHLCQLENDTETIVNNVLNSDFVITSPSQSTGDKAWLKYYKEKTYYLMSLKDGSRKSLVTGIDIRFWLSPNKRFLVYFDSKLKNYMSYDIENRSTKNITKLISLKLTDDDIDEIIDPNPLPAGIAGWLSNGNLLVRDNYDLWIFDPSGTNVPENLTNGYGRANNIKFDLISDHQLPEEQIIYPTNKPLLLAAFYVSTKQNGFYKLEINKKGGPQLLSVHDCVIYASPKQSSGFGLLGSKIRKADYADVWIVKKQTMADAPNFYSTSDFKTFKRRTNMQPQQMYRWATSELVTWKMPNGKICEGILYKPEGFNPNQKYPVIINYYEKKSGGLHEFFRPELIGSDLNIPWFVSRGYLVFTPDIHYAIDSAAESVVNSVIPGVKELLKLPFVDSSAIGIQGQSFGGYETNVLITESYLFACAAEGAGRSDQISGYGSLLPTERSYGQGSSQLELGGQYRLNVTLWANQQAYIENSPIFNADKVTTPLLIRHNKRDEAVPWGQAVEMFIALRRLDKPVWMLQYDEGGHGNESGRDVMDYTIRLTQFFDHYLKREPAPRWLTQGIPAPLKGIITGYPLDPAGNCSKDCKICKKWNELMVKEETKKCEVF